MNERIEALKKLATKEVWGNNPYNGSPEFDGYELDAEKFAELIVQECVTVIEGSSWNLPHGYKAVDQAALVKKHFGVE